MSSRSLLTVGLISMAVFHLPAGGDVLQMELGQFYFRGEYSTVYSGEYEEYLAVSHEGPYQRFVSDFHLGRLIEEQNLGSVAWIKVTGPDTETSIVNPGADIDLFTLEGLGSGVTARYEYEGPNTLYQEASSSSLAAEVAVVDFYHGQNDTDQSFVSLGTSGNLSMWFEGVSDDGGQDDEGDESEGDGTDDGGDNGDSGKGGVLADVFDIEPGLGSQDGQLRDSGLETQASIVGVSGMELWLRVHEIAPIAEWVTINIGYASSSVPVPGPAGVMALGAGTILIRRKRRR